MFCTLRYTKQHVRYCLHVSRCQNQIKPRDNIAFLFCWLLEISSTKLKHTPNVLFLQLPKVKWTFTDVDFEPTNEEEEDKPRAPKRFMKRGKSKQDKARGNLFWQKWNSTYIILGVQIIFLKIFPHFLCIFKFKFY
jgi:hypothetical protein